MTTQVVTRLAPTPSGYLHEGNAVNFLLVSWLARQRDAEVVLRIDDMDAPRMRPEYVDDILDVLTWLQIGWDRGPRSREDFEARYSLARRTGHYREELDRAVARGLPVFACRCTRREAREAGVAGCLGPCAAEDAPAAPGETALRMRFPGVDPVLWRRDDLPSYHLASVIEDRDAAVTLVVRGDDLRQSTAVQRELAPYLAADAFANAEFVHHPLLVGADGAKLSKSTRDHGPMTRDEASLRRVREHARAIAEPLGIDPAE
jgi:glutamyl-tRNA synthetase